MVRSPALALAVVAVAVAGGCAGRSLAPDPSAHLEGSSWRAVSVHGVPPVAGHDVTLTFENGAVVGGTGCNGFSAEIVSRGGRMGIEAGPMTAAMCVDRRASALETRVMEVLQDAPVVEILPGTMRVRAPAGEIVYEKVP